MSEPTWRHEDDAPRERFTRIVAIDYVTGEPRIAFRDWFTDGPDMWVWEKERGMANFTWWMPMPPSKHEGRSR